MKKIFTIIVLFLGAMSFEGQAQMRKKQFSGEENASQILSFTKSEAIEAKSKGLSQTAEGLKLKPDTDTEIILVPQKIELRKAKPFIASYTIWKGTGLDFSKAGLYFRVGKSKKDWSEWKEAEFDGHDEQSAERIVSKMQFIPQDMKFIQYKLIVAQSEAKTALKSVELKHYSPGETPKSEIERAKNTAHIHAKTTACSKPPVVSRGQWGAIFRSPAPTSNVTHLIVHHEFGSNSSSDWAARVRAVQSFHINGNGWSDIGYNFLVDPNGVIYEGRAGGDNAIGAHFCGRNRNTMAVCMLGDYSVIAPTSSSQNSLKNILAWKADKENISPTGTSSHYGRSLRHIAGHRDGGCSACPGNGMYNLMSSVRSSVSSLISNGCSGGSGGGGGSTDTQAPTTSISGVGGTSHSGDFDVTFTDNDNVGVTRTYYQVLEKYGADWLANRNNGFFNDNFNNFYSGYTVSAGSWAINSGRMRQSSTSIDNTQLSSYLIQNSGLPYLYEFSARLVSTSGPKKFGIHIMASSQTQSQRGNSYLIWISGAESKIRIYETINNSLFSRAVADMPLDNNWAKYRVTYSPAYGVIQVFKNNSKVLEWTDSTPIASGSSISLRTNNTIVDFDDLKVYKYRIGNRITITAGSSSSDDARTSSCKVKSMVRDDAGNWSAAGNLDVSLNLNQRLAFGGDSHDVTIYPNLVIDKANLNFNMAEAGNFSAKIFNSQGVLVAELPEEYLREGNHIKPLDSFVQKLKAGIYIVKLNAGKETNAVRLLKQ